MKMKMLTPLNWFGPPKVKFRRFLSKTLGFESKVSGDLRKIMTMIANLNVTDSDKDEMVAQIVVSGRDTTELDWREYR